MSDQLHRQSCRGRAHDAADAPCEREGSVAGDQGSTGEALTELDERHGVDPERDPAPDENERPDEPRVEDQGQQQAANQRSQGTDQHGPRRAKLFGHASEHNLQHGIACDETGDQRSDALLGAAERGAIDREQGKQDLLEAGSSENREQQQRRQYEEATDRCRLAFMRHLRQARHDRKHDQATEKEGHDADQEGRPTLCSNQAERQRADGEATRNDR